MITTAKGKVCKHQQFGSIVDVFRLTNEDGEVNGYCADISVKCQECGEEFSFLGPPIGSSPTYATVNVNRTSLRVPIFPGAIWPIEEIVQ